MLKEAIEKIISLAETKRFEIGDETYTDKQLYRVVPPVDRPARITVNGLDSIVKLVRNELDMLTNLPVYIRVTGNRDVDVFTAWDGYMVRDELYRATYDGPVFSEGWRDHQTAIIELQSGFIQNAGTAYLLDLLSSISKEDAVTSNDNGVTQEVTAHTGVALKQRVGVKPRVALAPYRTFSEVEQPLSEFLLRVDSDGRIGLFGADGGKWKLDAKRNIAGYFEQALADQIDGGKVVVMV